MVTGWLPEHTGSARHHLRTSAELPVGGAEAADGLDPTVGLEPLNGIDSGSVEPIGGLPESSGDDPERDL